MRKRPSGMRKRPSEFDREQIEDHSNLVDENNVHRGFSPLSCDNNI